MTIKDIARISGYGIGTVSRVINNQTGVSDVAREKILRVIEENGFEPNVNAKHLKMAAKSAVVVIIKGNQNMLFADIVERIQNQLAGYDEDVIVEYIDEDGDEIEYAIKLIRSVNPKGIMFLGANLALFDERVEEMKIPGVIITTSGESLGNDNISSITIDDTAATYDMTKYLLEKGHRHIGVIGGQVSEKQISFNRYEGCKRAIDEWQHDDQTEFTYIPCRYSMKAGYEATKRLLKEHPEITAVMGLSDTIAIGAMRAAVDLGKHIPEELSVAGFDGIETAGYCIPRLTTIKQNTETMASRSVDIMLKHINYAVAGEHEIVPYSLIEGESVKSIG